MLFHYQVVRRLIFSLNSTLLILLQCCSTARKCIILSPP